MGSIRIYMMRCLISVSPFWPGRVWPARPSSAALCPVKWNAGVRSREKQNHKFKVPTSLFSAVEFASIIPGSFLDAENAVVCRESWSSIECRCFCMFSYRRAHTQSSQFFSLRWANQEVCGARKYSLSRILFLASFEGSKIVCFDFGTGMLVQVLKF